MPTEAWAKKYGGATGSWTWDRGPLGKAIALKDYDYITKTLSRLWDVGLISNQIVSWVECAWAWLFFGLRPWPTDDYITMVLKNCADRDGAFRGMCQRLPQDHTSCVMHGGFLCIYETPEELERLRKYKPKEDDVRDPGPATSGIERTVLAEIHPIDKTAMRVTQ